MSVVGPPVAPPSALMGGPPPSTCGPGWAPVGLAQPGHDGVGHVRPRRRAGRLPRPRRPRGGGGEVACPPSPGPATRRPGCTPSRAACSTASACRTPAWTPGWRRSSRRSRPPAPRSWRASGASRVEDYGRPRPRLGTACRERRPALGGRGGGGQLSLPERRGPAGACSPTPGGGAATRWARPPPAWPAPCPVGQAQPQRDRPARPGRRRPRRRGGGASPSSTP